MSQADLLYNEKRITRKKQKRIKTNQLQVEAKRPEKNILKKRITNQIRTALKKECWARPS